MRRPHEVATYLKEIVDRAVDGEKALDVAQRFEASHVAFPLAGGLVRDFGAVVGIFTSAMMDGGEGGPLGCGVAAQFVGDESVGDVL